jgi:Xaa-Pro aminopeptidase
MNLREFASRRRHVLRMLDKDSVLLLPTAAEKTRNRDVHFPFRAESDFYYLTGFAEPEALLVLRRGARGMESILFCRDRDPDKERWDGYRVGPEAAVSQLGFDQAYPIDDLGEILPGLLEGCERIYCNMGADPEFDAAVLQWVNELRQKTRQGVQAPSEFVALDPMLHELRLFKSRAELTQMRKAAKITVAAHKRAMRAVHPGMMEYQLEAEYLHEFHSHGARSPAYPSIVAGGNHATILHYIENNDVLNDGDLVLVDAGAELDHYASDVTRTYPVNGQFSSVQRELYDMVLEAQHAAFAKVQPGNHWGDPHDAAVRVLTKGMIQVGLLKGGLAENLKKMSYRRFYMHRTGHWLGMDVHDVGEYQIDGRWRLLEPGMVLTVEPGLYVSRGERGVKKALQGIGIRIEDDLVVSKDGYENLTVGVPTDADEIERWMAAA